jgi:regulator of RNase E activity RraA
MTDQELFEKLRSVALDSAWGALTRLGFGDQFIGGLQVIRPERVMVGRAKTLRYLPARKDLAETMRARGPALNAMSVEEAEPGDVLVVDSGGCVEAGFMGDNIAARFIYRGGVGIVCDGAVRDLTELRKMPVSLYIRGAHAAASGRRLVAVDRNIPVRCVGVTVLPGDILMGDAEGVLVIPRAVAEQVATEAAATDDKELFLRRKLEAGASIYGVYPPNEATLKEYAEYKRTQSG